MSELLAVYYACARQHRDQCVSALSTQERLERYTFRDIAISVSQFMSQITFLTKS